MSAVSGRIVRRTRADMKPDSSDALLSGLQIASGGQSEGNASEDMLLVTRHTSPESYRRKTHRLAQHSSSFAVLVSCTCTAATTVSAKSESTTASYFPDQPSEPRACRRCTLWLLSELCGRTAPRAHCNLNSIDGLVSATMGRRHSIAN